MRRSQTWYSDRAYYTKWRTACCQIDSYRTSTRTAVCKVSSRTLNIVNIINLSRIFVLSVGIALLVLALMTLTSISAGLEISHPPDPLLGMRLSTLFIIVAVLELIIAMNCIFGKQIIVQLNLILWLTIYFIGYYLGMLLIHSIINIKGYLWCVSTAFGLSVCVIEIFFTCHLSCIFSSEVSFGFTFSQ